MTETLEIHSGPLPAAEILSRWNAIHRRHNHGALTSFTGTIREEDGIEALSFDLYRPILSSWFQAWADELAAHDSLLFMAHSEGDVTIGTSSYLCAISSPKRRIALEYLDRFVEDFKRSAPIWKYDVIDGKRRYAEERSTPLHHAGILR